jgi:hypothetical protein
MKRQSFPAILHLSGVSLRKTQNIDDVFVERCFESTEIDESVQYDKIPEIFTGIKHWRHSTNIRCWNCDFKFENIPVFVPTSFKLFEDERYEFRVLGNFCSFSCAAAWVNSSIYDTVQKMETMNRLCLLFYSFTGRHIDYINSSPLRTDKVQYGGGLTTKQFKDRIVELNMLPPDAETAGKPETSRGMSIWDLCERRKNIPSVDVYAHIKPSEEDFDDDAVSKFVTFTEQEIDEF